MLFSVLGPLEARCGDRAVALGGPRQRAVLAVLLLHADEVVPVERLIDWLWDDQPPPTAKAVVHSHVSRLRRALTACQPGGAAGGRQPVVTAAAGYRLDVRRHQIDLRCFEQLVAQARGHRTAGRLEAAGDGLRAALRLWRGPPLAGTAAAGAPLPSRLSLAAARLEEQRRVVLEERLEVDLALGRHAELAAELEELTGAHPLRERLWALRMLALHRSGRQAEALGVYRDVRTILIEELGIEPGPELQRLQRSMLAAGPDAWRLPADLAAAADVGAEPGGLGRVRATAPLTGEPSLDPAMVAAGVHPLPAPSPPRQLPRSVRSFTGRADELQRLVGLVGGSGTGEPGVVAVISGPAGVGKSTLAIHAAHELAGRFPDGQLYADLHGTTPGLTPLDPRTVLGRFLRTLSPEHTPVPADPEEAAALVRSAIAGRRMLLVLDNAASEAQVRPLLPASAGCGVLVTSRRVLAALDDACHLPLDVLPEAESVRLLGRLADDGRVAADPEGAAELARLCGNLPLALRIAGARLAATPPWTLTELVERLADERRRLDELQVGDLAVRASFAVSYERLDPAARQAFRSLALLDTTYFAAWAAATLLACPVSEAEAVLERLRDAGLLDLAGRDAASGPVRYRLHDLLAVFARERLRHEEQATALQQTLGRALGSLDSWISLSDRMKTGAEPGSHRSLRHDAGGRGQPRGRPAEEPAWAAACTLVAFFFEYQSYWDDWRTTRQVALIAAQRVGDRLEPAHGDLRVLPGFRPAWDDLVANLEASRSVFRDLREWHWHAAALFTLGNAYRAQGRLDDAAATLDESARRFGELQDRGWEAAALFGLGSVQTVQGALDDAIACYRRCLAIFRELGDRLHEARTLRAMGYAFQQHGRFDEAVAALAPCPPVLAELNDPLGEAHALLTLGNAHRELGHDRQALTSLRGCLAIFERLGDRRSHAMTLRSLAEVERRQGRYDDAITRLGAALAIFQELDDPIGTACTLHSLGRMHHALGRADRAVAQLRRCLLIFRGLGLRIWEASVERSLDRILAGP